MRTYGTVASGIRTPIIQPGDHLVQVVVDSILAHVEAEGTPLKDRDIIGVTEAVLARAQGNYATCEQIAADVRTKFPSGSVGIVFPILSRNRFSILLRGIAQGVEKLYVQLSYPSDEVGNHFITPELLYEKGVNFYEDVFTEAEFRALFGDIKHQFTSVDYLELFRSMGDNIEIILANHPTEILKHTSQVILGDIHTRHITRKRLEVAGATKIYDLSEMLSAPVNGSGYNPEYGLLGSNKADDNRVKLFPHSCQNFVNDVQALIFEQSGAKVEVLVYGDGAFKDPVGKIWELADPVVSPAYTEGLGGLPNELKLKYIADTELKDKRGEEARAAMVARIREKGDNMMTKDKTEGTTPRRLCDLVGSLCDLVSGSGDKGTPVVFIRGYFDNYADN